MENSGKALLIAGAIIICVLIVAVGMFIYNSASATTTDSMSSMSTREIETFNSQFNIYEGLQTGTQIKNLIGLLVGNANTNKDNPTKIPGVGINKCVSSDTQQLHAQIPDAGDVGDYINVLSQIRNKVEKKHEYWIEISYQDNGFIDYITITYDSNNPEAVYTRDHLKFPSI